MQLRTYARAQHLRTHARGLRLGRGPGGGRGAGLLAGERHAHGHDEAQEAPHRLDLREGHRRRLRARLHGVHAHHLVARGAQATKHRRQCQLGAQRHRLQPISANGVSAAVRLAAAGPPRARRTRARTRAARRGARAPGRALPRDPSGHVHDAGRDQAAQPRGRADAARGRGSRRVS